MREINLADVTAKVKETFIDACDNIPDGVLRKIKAAAAAEQSPLGRDVLNRIVENDLLAAQKRLPLCQDTGVAVVMLTIGSEVVFKGDIYAAVNEGVRQAYVQGYLRKSVVRHPLDRVNTKDNTPAVSGVKIVPGEDFIIDVAPKGGGSENMSFVKMLIPADGRAGVEKLVLSAVSDAGGKPCPPIILGLGIGGNLEKCALLAKEALFRDVDDESPDPIDRELERDLLKKINGLGVGPMGFGGTVTCLAVKVNSYPCHIASLPVAVNIQCHSARHVRCRL
jgi:fumarate hydratase subunit alpha